MDICALGWPVCDLSSWSSWLHGCPMSLRQTGFWSGYQPISHIRITAVIQSQDLLFYGHQSLSSILYYHHQICHVTPSADVKVNIIKWLNYPYNAEIVYINHGDHKISICVLVSSFRYIWIPMLWVYGYYILYSNIFIIIKITILLIIIIVPDWCKGYVQVQYAHDY